MFVAGVGRGRGPAGHGSDCLGPNFPYVLSAAVMDPIIGHGRSSSEEGMEIEEIDEGAKMLFSMAGLHCQVELTCHVSENGKNVSNALS